MSFLSQIKQKIAEFQGQESPLEEISQPMLERIGEKVSGGAGSVWCRAAWGSGCTHVNVN
jgi:hypothetical protein